MKSSAEKLFDKIEILYENIYNLLIGFQQASTTNFTDIEVPIKKLDGTVENMKINSFQQIQQELNKLSENFKSLTNTDNISYVVNGDGSLSQVTKTSFINTEYLENFHVDDICFIDKRSVINDLIYPMVKIPVTIDSTIRTPIRCTIYDVSIGFESIKDDATILDIQYLISTGEIIAKEYVRTLELEKEQVRYFGYFSVLNVKSESNSFEVKLGNIQYKSINSIGESIDLKVGDLLCNKEGTAKFQITYIDKFNKIIKCTRIAGEGSIKVNEQGLVFNEVLPSENNIVGIPVQPSKKLAVFLSTENLKVIGFPSNVLKIDTTDYRVQYDDKTYTLDEYFSKYVTNFSEYLLSIIKETSIPISLGVKPDKPVLNTQNFKVKQINKHLTSSKTNEEISKLNEQKQKILNDIKYKENLINVIQNELDTLKYSSLEEKNASLNRIFELRSEVNILNQNLLTVSRNLDTNAIQYGLKDFKPKYKIMGFWDIQAPIYSPLTKAQNIIKYEVQYRYLSREVDTVDNTSMKMISNGKEISVVFSAWNELQTTSLNKVEDINGNYVWQSSILDSVDDININQCLISINEGESVEIRVRSVSEAGYPIAPLKSDWSEIIRIDFPDDLLENNVVATVEKNTSDLEKAEFNDILRQSGILGHIANTIKEAEKTFMHPASDIASGLYTEEQKNIPLDVAIKNIMQKIELLENTDLNDNILIQVVDFKGDLFTVTNNTTLSLSAGNYSDSINLLNKDTYGSIIRKQGYIKIKNNNIVPIELKTLIPGTQFNQENAEIYYPVPVKTEEGYQQKSKQVIYFRSLDLTGATSEPFKLIRTDYNPTPTVIDGNLIDASATEEKKNLVYLDGSEVKICKLKDNVWGDFICYTIEHPNYNAGDKQLMQKELEHLSYFTKIIKEQRWQAATITDEELEQSKMFNLGFKDEDFYAVGKNSCGAYFYPTIPNQAAISVVGNTTIATLIIPKESEILIPIIFEFRMMDRFGNIDGVLNNENNDITYMKKIGVDLMLNNNTFKFDIEATSKLRSKVTPIESLSVNSVVGKFTGESKEKLQ